MAGAGEGAHARGTVQGGHAVLKRSIFFAFGIASYLVFLATFLYSIAFVGGFAVPTQLDGGPRGPCEEAGPEGP